MAASADKHLHSIQNAEVQRLINPRYLGLLASLAIIRSLRVARLDGAAFSRSPCTTRRLLDCSISRLQPEALQMLRGTNKRANSPRQGPAKILFLCGGPVLVAPTCRQMQCTCLRTCACKSLHALIQVARFSCRCSQAAEMRECDAK